MFGLDTIGRGKVMKVKWKGVMKICKLIFDSNVDNQI